MSQLELLFREGLKRSSGLAGLPVIQGYGLTENRRLSPAAPSDRVK